MKVDQVESGFARGIKPRYNFPMYAKLSDEKKGKGKKTALFNIWQGYFIEYKSESIYQVYFLDSQWIEIIYNLKFNKYDTNPITEEREVEELFSFSNLKQVFIYDLPIRKAVLIPALWSTSLTSTSLALVPIIEDNDKNKYLWSSLSNNNIAPLVR